MNVGQNFEKLNERAQWLRQTVLQMATRAKSGHISTAFSQAELLVALYYGGILKFDAKNEDWEGRDRFILSKGQGGIGLYPVLADLGYFPTSELIAFTGEDSLLGVHADWHIPGIEVITGSLGHGLPIATGKALVLKQKKADPLVVCMLGDAELYEGSNWEAAIMAAHLELGNLICIVDRNGQGVLGKTDEIETTRDGPRLNPVDKKFESFGFETRVIDGHDYAQIFDSMKDIRTRGAHNKPLAIIANTFKGKGSSLMEDKRMWHYRIPTGDDLKTVQADITKGGY